jgi:hypothetical protein
MRNPVKPPLDHIIFMLYSNNIFYLVRVTIYFSNEQLISFQQLSPSSTLELYTSTTLGQTFSKARFPFDDINEDVSTPYYCYILMIIALLYYGR